MKTSHLLAFLGGAAVATGVTLLMTTEKGKEIRTKVSEKLSKEELEKLIEKLKCQHAKMEKQEAAAEGTEAN